MTEITVNKNIYLYGKYYDNLKVETPKDEENWDLIIYVHPLSEDNRIISSLEGIFVSEIPLIRKQDKGVRKDWQIPIRRQEMIKFEEKYQGKFFSFER